jgi:hypothetical protein
MEKVGDQQEGKKGEGNKLSVEAFHWARSHNILQIKGNQTVYQTKWIYNDE